MTGEIRSELVLVTPMQAQTWLTENAYDRQRKLREQHVTDLANEMRIGQFKPTAQVGFANCNGRPQLVNGRHTLNAIVKCGIAQWVNVVRHEVKTQDEVNELYAMYDIGVRRTQGEILDALGIAETMEMTQTNAGHMACAARLIQAKFILHRNPRITIPSRVVKELCLEYQKAGRQYFELTAGCPKEIVTAVHRATTLAIALLTLRYGPPKLGQEKVANFWTGAIFDDGVPVGDPRKLVNRHFYTEGLPGGGNRYGGKRKIASYDSSMYTLARCWKAWVNGEQLKQVQLPDDLSSISVVSTPY